MSVSKELNTKESIAVFDFDPATWKRPYSPSFIAFLVEKGTEQDKDADFSSSEKDGRKFLPIWYQKIMSNGEIVKRDWLIYSKIKKSIFCFPCLLFGTSSTRSSKLADPECGFSNWKKLNPKVPLHENSDEHRNSYIQWKELERRLK